MLSWRELRMSVGTLPFLDRHAGSPRGVLELRVHPAPKMLVWHPDAIDWIFRSDQWMRHPGSRSLTPLFGTRSLLWADGARHVAYRHVLGPPLRGRGLTAYRGTVADTVHAAIDTLAPGTVVALPVWTRRLTLRIVARIVLGRSDEELLTVFTRWIERALGARHRALTYRYLAGGLPRSGAGLDELLVRTARSNVDARPVTLASLMLTGDGPLGRVDDVELRDAIVSLLFAGHETTASAAAWTLYRLDRDARIRANVLAELAAGPADGSDASRLPLLQAVIQEALRLAPPVTVAENRALTGEGELLGRHLPAGTTLTPSIYLAHRHPEHFPNPYRFDPDRFLGRRVPAHHYFPFGGGSRYCLGSQLAQLEIRMITAAVLRRVDWRCVNPSAAVPRLRGHAMAPDSGLCMKVLSCRR
jgi:cytochrome P450 family 110